MQTELRSNLLIVRDALERVIKNCHPTICPGLGHLLLYHRWPEILAALQCSESVSRGSVGRTWQHNRSFALSVRNVIKGMEVKRMIMLLGLLSIVLLGLVSGVSFSHLLQRGPKAALSAPQFLSVQQVLLRNYGAAIGGLEVAAFLASLGLAIASWDEPRMALFALFAAGCVLVMIGIWVLWINPINKAVKGWSPESLPANWASFRDRWHLLHTIRLVLSIMAFSALIVGLYR